MSSANLNIKITATIDNRGGAVSSTLRYSSTNVSISISSPCSPWTRTGRSVATVVSQQEEATGKPNLRRGTLGGQRRHRGRLWRMNVARPATADRTGCDHSTSEALSRPPLKICIERQSSFTVMGTDHAHSQVAGRHPESIPNMLGSNSGEIAMPWGGGFERVVVNLRMPFAPYPLITTGTRTARECGR